MERLDADFYSRANVVLIANELLGKVLCTQFGGELTTGRIVETEAYNGITDKASHAYNGRRTARTETMYAQPGTSYVYLCYGIHHLFNVVTNAKDVPHAILIRALEPLAGIPTMLRRTGKTKQDFTLTRGPGNVSKALGINTKHTGLSIFEEDIWIADDGYKVHSSHVIATPRIGVGYAGVDALLPYRFYLKGNKNVSGKMLKLV